jgi:hypothetical protein
MMVYNGRSDLQSLFPNAYGNWNSYVGLVNWAGGTVTQQWVDGNYGLLNPYGYWYVLMYRYNFRSDLQALWPNAYSSWTSYQSLVNWGGGTVTKQWVDGDYSALNRYGYWFALMMVYNSRSDLQNLFPAPYASGSSYQALLQWAKGVVDKSWTDGSYNTLLPYKSTYDTLG